MRLGQFSKGEMVSLLFLALLAFLSGCRREEVSLRWESYSQGLPSCAQVLAIAEDPAQPGVLYAGAYHPPVLWCSEDGGESWAEDGRGLGEQPVFALYCDRLRDCWWACTGGGLHTRPAGGDVWEAACCVDGPAYALAEDEAGRLYLALANEGLFRSSDGQKWDLLLSGPTEAESGILAVAVSCAGREIYAGTGGAGLWLSNDGGENWSSVPEMAGEYVSALLVEPGEGRWVYARTLKGIYRSDDHGQSWTLVPGLKKRAYALALGEDGALYAALKGKIARSDDGGLSPAFFKEGFFKDTDVLDLAVSPHDPARLYVAARDGVYRSFDWGRTWERCSEGLGKVDVGALAWDGRGELLAGTWRGIYCRVAGDDEWKPASPDFQERYICAFSGSPDRRVLYAGTSAGLLRSDNGGLTWGEVPSNLSEHQMPALAVDPRSPDHLYIRLDFERIYESLDGGRTWEARGEGLGPAKQVVCVAMDPAGKVLLAGGNDGLFRWEPSKGAWYSVAPPLEGQSVFALAFVPGEERVIYAGATDGLWRSINEGKSWARWAEALAGHTVSAIAFDPADEQILYIGTMYEGLYMSHDSGATWRQVREGLPAEMWVRAILPDLEGQEIYLATDRGVFRGVKQ